MAGGNFHDRADEPALLYVVRHEQLDALKVGVVTHASRAARLRAHTRRGWTTELTLEFTSGHQALQAERAVVRFLRDCGATELLPQREMPQGGYTETVARAALVDLDRDLLVAIARAAGRIVRKAACPISRFFRDIGKEMEGLQAMIDAGQKDDARALALALFDALKAFEARLDEVWGEGVGQGADGVEVSVSAPDAVGPRPSPGSRKSATRGSARQMSAPSTVSRVPGQHSERSRSAPPPARAGMALGGAGRPGGPPSASCACGDGPFAHHGGLPRREP